MKLEGPLSIADTRPSVQPAMAFGPGFSGRLNQLLFLAFFASWAVQIAAMLSTRTPVLPGVTGVFACLAAALTLVNMSRQLPVQNTVACTVVSVGVGTAIGLWAEEITRSSTSSTLELRFLEWLVPVFWIVTVLNCRAVARFMLSGLKRSNPGLWTLGLASTLIVAWAVSMDCFSINVGHRSIPSQASMLERMIPHVWLRLPACWVAGLATLITMAPWLINKKPVNESPNLGAFAIWLLVNLYFLVGLSLLGNGLIATVILSLTALVTIRVLQIPRHPEPQCIR